MTPPSTDTVGVGAPGDAVAVGTPTRVVPWGTGTWVTRSSMWRLSAAVLARFGPVAAWMAGLIVSTSVEEARASKSWVIVTE